MSRARDLSAKVPDLGPDAIEARRRAGKRGHVGGFTGRQLIEHAASNFEQAKRLAKAAARRQRKATSDRADHALMTAACQIRLAAECPLAKPYLHVFTVKQIDRVKADVLKEYEADDAALAVDTHRRIADQRLRSKREPR